MDSQTFYEKLTIALLQLGFHANPDSFSKQHLEEEQEFFVACIRTGMKVAGQLAESLFDIPERIGDIDASFDKESFQSDWQKIYSLTNLIFYKFILSQPVIIAAFEADSLSTNELKRISDKLLSILEDFQKHTGSIGPGFKSGPSLLRKTKLSVTAFSLFVFFDSQNAKNFIAREQESCKRSKIFKKINLLPWVIDVQVEKVISSPSLLSKLPFSDLESTPLSALNRKKLEQLIFDKVA